LAFIATTFAAQAQFSGSIQTIDADDVPALVISSQATYFPDATVTVWKKQTASGRKRSAERYVANFRNDGQKARARYYKNGAGATAVTYYKGSELPAAIQEAAATNYADYTLVSGEQIITLPTSDICYHLRLRKDAQKTTVYVDESGKELSEEEVPKELEEEG